MGIEIAKDISRNDGLNIDYKVNFDDFKNIDISKLDDLAKEFAIKRGFPKEMSFLYTKKIKN